MNSYYCPVCGKKKYRNHRICKNCFESYGKKAENWPGWVRFAVNDAKRMERSLAAQYLYEIDIELDINYIPKPIKTRDWADSVVVGYDSLPYAPYENEQDNIRYRKVNGIMERKNE